MQDLSVLVEKYRSAATREEKLAAGDEIARLISPPLYVFIKSQIRSRGSAESLLDDVLGKTLTAIIKGLDNVIGKSSPGLWAYCRQVARHRLIEDLRKLASAKTIGMDPEDLEKAIDAAGKDESMPVGVRHDLDYAFSLLRASKPPCEAYLRSYYLDGMDHAEIADMYSLSPNALRMRFKRCLELAQELMSKNP